MLDRLIGSGVMQCVPAACDVVIFDQSTDAAMASAYMTKAGEMGASYVHNDNRGASAAKRNQIIHASKNGFALMSQVSEDLVLSPGGEVSWLPRGAPSFIDDSIKIMEARSHIQFVNHNMVMCGNWNACSCFPHNEFRTANLSFHKLEPSRLAHVEGETMITGWPYTARVKFMAKCAEMVLGIAPSSTYEQFSEGGEWVLGRYTFGAGASLVARTFYHDRGGDKKPVGSRP